MRACARMCMLVLNAHRYLYFNGWVFREAVLDEKGNINTYQDPYITAMYWAVTTMSTIGYGDICPVTGPERILVMILMLVGCAFFAWFTGKITTLMTSKSPCEERFVSLMEEVREFMKMRDLPASLCDRIDDYYKVKYPSKRVFDENDLIKRIEDEVVQREIVAHLFKDVVNSVPFFKMCDDDVRMDICFKLKSIYRMAGSEITKAGTNFVCLSERVRVRSISAINQALKSSCRLLFSAHYWHSYACMYCRFA